LILITGFLCRSAESVQLLLVRRSGQVASRFAQSMMKRHA
jgi:hypothetical protein